MKHTVLVLFILIFSLNAQARENGLSQFKINAAGVEINVFTYRPSNCTKPSILFVFHGLNRKAESVRNKAVKIAQNACLMIFSPLFDKQRFPNWRYHRAGVVYRGDVTARSKWTAPILQSLLKQARQHVGNHSAKVYLFGHSAGGQFLSRIAAYTPALGVERIVIANPSVYVAPLLDKKAPYGFAGVFPASKTLHQLKNYLALPITIYLGQQDTGSKNLVKSKAAMKQGINRLQRGRNIYNLAKNMALQKDWSFNWQLVEVPDAGHSSRAMLEASQLNLALGICRT